MKSSPMIEDQALNPIESPSVEGLWGHYLKRGEVHLFVGTPGVGKTNIALSFAAAVSRGGPWPDGTGCEPGNVLLHCFQDHYQKTIIPRLMAHQADLKRVQIFRPEGQEDFGLMPFHPMKDVLKMQEVLMPGAFKLIIIDPLENLISSHFHTNPVLKKELRHLHQLARHCHAAVMGISYVTKGASQRSLLECLKDSLDKSEGVQSLGIAESVFDPQGKCRKFLFKTTRGQPDYEADEYQINTVSLSQDPRLSTCAVSWYGPSEMKIHALKQCFKKGYRWF